MKNDDGEVRMRGGRLAANLIAGGYTILLGVFLLLVGLKVFGPTLTMRNCALPTILAAIGLVFFTTALVQINSVSLWLSFAFFVPALVTYLSNFTAAGYAQLYPLYIAIPAIASLLTIPMAPSSYRDLLVVVGFFGVIAALFALQSSGVVGWGVVVPLLVVFVGLTVVFAAIMLGRKEVKQDEE